MTDSRHATFLGEPCNACSAQPRRSLTDLVRLHGNEIAAWALLGLIALGALLTGAGR